jgi:hypothetical protein
MKTEKRVYTRYECANSPGFALCEHVTLTGLLRSYYLGVPNLYFVHFPNNPPASQFRQYAIDFRPMQRVVWVHRESELRAG